MRRLLAAAVVVLAAGPAAAESPLWGSFQLRFTPYRPNIDAEFHGAAYPYRDIFGSGRGWLMQFEVARSVYTGYGTVDVGAGAGWFSKSGRGVIASGPLAGTPSGDETTLRVLPLTLSATYRFDRFVKDVPLVPYARLSLERWIWWVTTGGGGTSQGTGGVGPGSGATNGWGAALGVCFLLDFLDPTLAREMDRDTGINHTYLYFETGRTKVNDFGSSKSWDLSGDRSQSYTFGILFVF